MVLAKIADSKLMPMANVLLMVLLLSVLTETVILLLESVLISVFKILIVLMPATQGVNLNEVVV